MRKTFVFIADSRISAADVEATLVDAKFATLAGGNKLMVLHHPVTPESVYVTLEFQCDELSTYEQSELASIRELIPDPQMIFLWFRDDALAAEVSRALLDRYDMVFDDDHGSISFKGARIN